MNDFNLSRSDSIDLKNNKYYFPMYVIGTYKKKKLELVNLFSAYTLEQMWIDTASRYENETSVSDALAISGYPSENVHYIGKISYSQQCSMTVECALNNTLSALHRSYIDCYLIHSPRYSDYCKTWNEMRKLGDKDLIKIIGVSNFGIDDLKKLYKETGEMPTVNQIVRTPETKAACEDLINFCQSRNIIVQEAMPFGGINNSTNISIELRKKILSNNFYRGIVSVVGTSSSKHLLQNLSVLEVLYDNYKKNNRDN